jgi:hypothetical protein
MSYVDGSVVAVPTANKEAYRAAAAKAEATPGRAMYNQALAVAETAHQLHKQAFVGSARKGKELPASLARFSRGLHIRTCRLPRGAR